MTAIMTMTTTRILLYYYYYSHYYYYYYYYYWALSASKMHLRSWLRPKPRWWSSQHSPRPT